MEDLAYRLETDKSFDDVVETIEKLVPENNFRVLAVHDVQETLAEKGFERDPLKIIEVCNAGFAHQALGKHIGVALFMPCRYTVHTEGNKTVVTLARPSMIAQMLPEAGLETLAGQVEDTLKKIMEQAIKS
jgi:uncharacterized protein (DUF302 family)